MYPKYKKHSPSWLARMKAMHNIWASNYAHVWDYNMADKCLSKIAKYQKVLTASKWFSNRLYPEFNK